MMMSWLGWIWALCGFSGLRSLLVVSELVWGVWWVIEGSWLVGGPGVKWKRGKEVNQWGTTTAAKGERGGKHPGPQPVDSYSLPAHTFLAVAGCSFLHGLTLNLHYFNRFEEEWWFSPPTNPCGVMDLLILTFGRLWRGRDRVVFFTSSSIRPKLRRREIKQTPGRTHGLDMWAGGSRKQWSRPQLPAQPSTKSTAKYLPKTNFSRHNGNWWRWEKRDVSGRLCNTYSVLNVL